MNKIEKEIKKVIKDIMENQHKQKELNDSIEYIKNNPEEFFEYMGLGEYLKAEKEKNNQKIREKLGVK